MSENNENKTVEVEKNEVKTYTEDEVNTRIQKAVQERLARVHKKYEGFEDMKAELEELRKFKEEQELASLSELEKLQKQLEAERQEKENYLSQFSQLEKQLKQERLHSTFKEKAREKGIKYVDDALKLSDLSQVEIGEDGSFSGIDEVIDQLIETKPFLLDKKEDPKPIGKSSNPPVQSEKTQEELLREAREKFQKSQRIEDMVAYINLKQKFSK